MDLSLLISPLPSPTPSSPPLSGPPTPRGPSRTAEMADSQLTLSAYNTDHGFRKRNVFAFQEVTTFLTHQMSTPLKRGFGKMPFITKGAQWSTFLSPANSMMVSQFQKIVWVTSGGSGGKESACNARGLGSILRLGRSLGEGNGYPLQYSSLKNSMDRGDWKATVHDVSKMQTWLSD